MSGNHRGPGWGSWGPRWLTVAIVLIGLVTLVLLALGVTLP